jgi:hypothetical protein
MEQVLGINNYDALRIFNNAKYVSVGIEKKEGESGDEYRFWIGFAPKGQSALRITSEPILATREEVIRGITETLEDIHRFARNENRVPIPSPYFRSEEKDPSDLLSKAMIVQIVSKLRRELEVADQSPLRLAA